MFRHCSSIPEKFRTLSGISTLFEKISLTGFCLSKVLSIYFFSVTSKDSLPFLFLFFSNDFINLSTDLRCALKPKISSWCFFNFFSSLLLAYLYFNTLSTSSGTCSILFFSSASFLSARLYNSSRLNRL